MTVGEGKVERRLRRRQPRSQASGTVKVGKRIEVSIWEIAERSVGGFVRGYVESVMFAFVKVDLLRLVKVGRMVWLKVGLCGRAGMVGEGCGGQWKWFGHEDGLLVSSTLTDAGMCHATPSSPPMDCGAESEPPSSSLHGVEGPLIQRDTPRLPDGSNFDCRNSGSY